MKLSHAILLLGLAGCAAPLAAPPIIAPAPPIGPMGTVRNEAGEIVKPVDGSTCLTWGNGAWCARWIADGKGSSKLEILRVQR